MHDPSTVAFDIKYPWRAHAFNKAGTKFDNEYRESFITIWHEDPERAGPWRGDDSCGWFMRAGHGKTEVLEAIVKAYAFDWDAEYGGWFDSAGKPRFSTIAIVLEWFRVAAYHHHGESWPRADRFVKKHLVELMRFAENPVDSAAPYVTGKYGLADGRDQRIRSMAVMVYGYVLRRARPAWRHPRWHVHHWRIQVHPWERLKRRLFDRCDGCGKHFSKGDAVFSNGGNEKPYRKIWHEGCAPWRNAPADDAASEKAA